MTNLYYSLPLDQLLRTVTTVTVDTGTEVTGYGVANIYDGNPARPLKIAGTAVDIVMNWASPVLPEFVALLNSNLDVAARIQGHTSDSWGTPDVDVALGIPTVSIDGWYSSPWADLSGETAKAWWRLHVTGNALPVIIGELWMGSTLRELGTHFLIDSAELADDVKTVVHETAYGVELSYEQGPRSESMRGSLRLSAAQLTAVRQLAEATRLNARPFLVVPDATVDDAWYVRLTDAVLPRDATMGTTSVARLGFRMVSRGLPWADPDA